MGRASKPLSEALDLRLSGGRDPKKNAVGPVTRALGQRHRSPVRAAVGRSVSEPGEHHPSVGT